MKKTKKLASFILAFIMLISTVCGMSITALAGGWLSYAEKINLNEEYQISASTTDYYDYHLDYWCSSYKAYFDVFEFSIPIEGSISIELSSENDRYMTEDWFLFNSSNLDSYLSAYYAYSYSHYNSAKGLYFASINMNLSKGTYYLVCLHDDYNTESGRLWGNCSLMLKYKPSILKPSTFKVASRNVNSLKLSWSKVGNASGYQLQRKSGSTYKTVANTTSTSYTVKNLSSATTYTFRVRTYKTVSGKKYYSSWKTLSTPTKPAKVSIKTPATNSKHQIIAKWNTVKRTSGYQVQYCKNKSCSNVIATKTISGQSKTSYTGNNFTKGRTYYVRVRAYKTVNGTKYYGSWSSVKSIKCK